MTSNKFIKILFTFITTGFVLFIFSNSMFPGPESSEKSQFVMNLINTSISRIGIHASITEHIVRKTGHFIEYFALGNLLILTVRMYVRRPVQYLFMELFILLSVPVLDEFLQTFIQGRSGNVSDILLDFTGGLAGMVLCQLLIHLFSSIPKLKYKSSTKEIETAD